MPSPLLSCPVVMLHGRPDRIVVSVPNVKRHGNCYVAVRTKQVTRPFRDITLS